MEYPRQFYGEQDSTKEGEQEFCIKVEFPEQARRADQLPSAFTRSARSARELVDDKLAARAATTLEAKSQASILAAMNTIREMARQTDLMRQGIPGGSQPRMIKVKFGITLSAEAGAFVAKAASGASLEIELEWARRSDDVLRVLRTETDIENALFTSAERHEVDADGTDSLCHECGAPELDKT